MKRDSKALPADVAAREVRELAELHGVSPLSADDLQRLAQRLLEAYSGGYRLTLGAEKPKPVRIAARFPGQCARCGERFGAGTAVLFDTGSRRTIHVDCKTPEAA